MLELMEIEPQGSPVRSSVIWLHGLGASGEDFAPLIEDWGLADEHGMRFVLPHAPMRPVTINNGMVMRGWYDIYELRPGGPQDEAGLEQARQALLELVAREEARGVPPERILLAGFSQGGAVVLHTALRRDEPLAGVLALSSYLPVPDRLAAEKQRDPASLVIRMDHGEQDDVVRLEWAERSCARMREEGFQVDFRRYVMGHSLCPPQIDSLRAWLCERLP